MNRRDLMKFALGAPAAAAQTTVRPSPARWRTDGREMPNVLWICSDQQRFDTIEGLNNTHVRRPT